MAKKRVKQIISTLLVISFLIPNMLVAQAAESDNTFYEFNDLKGIYRTVDSVDKIIESEDDFNYILDSLSLNFTSNSVALNTTIDEEDVLINVDLFPSQLGNNVENTIVGINNDLSNLKYDILKFTIENNASSSSLLSPNLDMAGQTVVSFALYNKITLEKYYFQFTLDAFDFDTAYSTALNSFDKNILSADDILNKEIAYFTLQPISDFKRSFQKINDMTFSDEVKVTEKSKEEIISEEELEGTNIDQMLELSKAAPIDLSGNKRALISDIPDYLYKIQENGTWSQGTTAWNTGSKVGYIVYHMNDSFSGNALNYVLRYYISSRFNWSSQQFDTSFNLSHNVWVQYIKSSNSIYVFDDRASNARIIISPSIFMYVDDENTQGYFNSKMTNAYKNGSMASKLASLIVGYVPKLGNIQKIYKTFTDNNSVGNNSKQFFELSYVREAEAVMTDLKYAPNNRGYAQDYVGITIWATNVNSIWNGYDWSCYAK